MSEHSPGSQHVIVAMLTVANSNNQHRIISQSLLISIVGVELKIVMSMLSRDFKGRGGEDEDEERLESFNSLLV